MEEDIVMLQEYHIHLLDGTVVRFSEDDDLPVEKRLITKIRKAKPTDVFSIGNPFDGYKYIPRSSRNFVRSMRNILSRFSGKQWIMRTS